MKISSLLFTLPFLLLSCTSQQVSNTIGILNDTVNGNKPLTSGEVSAGLKEALTQGISRGVVQAGKTDGFLGNPRLKIPFPEDAKKVENTLRDIGLGKEVDKFITSLNRGAEEASKSAKSIFVNAIKGMSIQDAFGILKGENNAATVFLRDKTEQQLISAFTPIMEKALQKVNATKYYGELVERYNKFPLVQKIDPDLTNYATQKAIDGLFVLVADEEARIRENPVARTTELLKRVFGSKQ